MKKYGPLLLFLVIVGLLGVHLFQQNRPPRAAPLRLISKELPQTELMLLNSMKPPFVINFFASWCVPCKAEHPVLMSIKKLPVFGVAYKDKVENVDRWLKDNGNPYDRMELDPQGRAAIDFGITGVPETFVVGKNGRILYRHNGPLTHRDWIEIRGALKGYI